MSEIYRSAAGATLLRETYLRDLAQCPVPADREFVDTPEGETFVLVSGPEQAPPLVLLHGSGSNSAEWGPKLAGLVDRYRVYAVDILGEPGLSAPVRPPLGSDRYARWLDSVLDAFGLGQVTVLGVSLGGWLALDYATRRPDRVGHLAVANPAGVGRQRASFLVKALFWNLFGGWGRRRSVAMTLGPAASTLSDERLHAVLERVVVTAKNYRYRREPIPVFDDTTLRRLTMPVHAVIGKLDVMVDATETVRRLSVLVPHASLHVLPRHGHLVPTELGT
ncbi:pimeloyl-ACP methyl ester carboxylesterase [Crossiella equi]|uniref:Pimeloyl-ACP methyl ester carboxylesterase n=1 Tax=Crossiella equi TaxID=130796 RepID=A0ABS5A419_9PSEU|nr:alpha/beta hydrolase [Crossiella equi]MBP2471322.1 pimeloyl-ACP methyl ester carboxylesterase [Crossiella equi]